jgi:SAM-dependent methyltransferase
VPDLHPTARGFERAARDYDHGRPGYPPEAVAWLVRRLQLVAGRSVLDVGAGTGALTRALVGHGAEVLAAEPLPAMRARLVAALPEVTVVDGTAEALPFPDGRVDAVTAAQAFHWFVVERALPELHRVLRPGGRLAVVFNRRDLTTPEQAALDALLAPYRGDTPSWATHDWERSLGGSRWFAPADLHRVRHVQHLDPPAFRARVASISFVARLGEDERHRVLAAADRLHAEHARDGRVALHYATEVRIAERRDDAAGPHPRAGAPGANR